MPTMMSDMHGLDDGHACAATLAWWQLEQTAWCPFCWQGYAWELHVACTGCDRPTCPLCVDHEDAGGPRCPECAREATEKEASA